MNFLERQLTDPVRFARIKRWFYIGLAGVALAEIILPLMCYLLKLVFEAMNLPALAEMFHVDHAHHFWFELWIPAWGSLYGLVSCVAIIVVSKLIGKAWLMRREDYHDR